MVSRYPGEDAFLGSYETGNFAQHRFSSCEGFLLPPHPQVGTPVSRKRIARSYASLLIQATDQRRSKKLFGLRSTSARFQRKCFFPLSANLRKIRFICQSTYLICGIPRSGSFLLCEALKNTGIAGVPEEYYWHGGKTFAEECGDT